MPVRYGWWGYVKDMIRRYPELKERDAESKKNSTTQNYERPAGGTAGRKTENAALSGMKEWDRRELAAVHAAVLKTKKMKNGSERLRLVELTFWRRTHTLEGAALAVHVSYTTAVRWNREFIYLVAERFGMLE